MTNYSDRGFYGRLPMSMQNRMDAFNIGGQNKLEPESTGYYTRCADGNYYRLPGRKDNLPGAIQGMKIQIMLQRTGYWQGVFPSRITCSEVERMQTVTGVLTDEVREIRMWRVNRLSQLQAPVIPIPLRNMDGSIAKTHTWKNTAPVTIGGVANSARYDDLSAYDNPSKWMDNFDAPQDEYTDQHLVAESGTLIDEDTLHELHQEWGGGMSEGLNKATARRMNRLETENRYYKNLSLKHQQMYIGAGAKIKVLAAEVERLKQFEPISVNPNVLQDKTDITRRFATMDLV